MAIGQKRLAPTRGESKLLNSLNSGNLEAGYEKAINYYKALKERFLNQIQNQAIQNDAKMAILAKEEIENLISLKALNRAEDFKRIDKIQEAVKEQAIKFLQGQAATKSGFLQQYESELQKNKITEKKQIVALARNILEKNRHLNFLDSIIKINLNYKGLSSSDLYTRFANYFTSVILSELGKINSAIAPRADQLAGYSHELAAVRALENKLYKVTHLGAKNVSADIALSATGNSAEEAIQELKKIQERIQNFNQSDAGYGTDTNDFTELFSALNINYFGSQVKLYSVALSGLSRIQGYSVGHRNDLLNQLKSENDNSKYISQRKNFEFFSKWNNIVSAMGVNNIIWSTGYAQYWMDDFIQKMRTNNYFLGFNYTSSGKITSEVKWYQLLTMSLYRRKLKK